MAREARAAMMPPALCFPGSTDVVSTASFWVRLHSSHLKVHRSKPNQEGLMLVSIIRARQSGAGRTPLLSAVKCAAGTARV